MRIHGLTRQNLMRFRRSTKGGALLELAVVFPVLLLLLIGVVDYGRMYFTSVAVANAARAGAEWGAFSPTNSVNDSGMQSFAALDGAEVAGNFQITSRHYCRCGNVADPTCAACSGGASPDVFVEVTATDTLRTLLTYPGLQRKIPIIRVATFRSQ